MSLCCEQNSRAFDGLSADYKRRLLLVIGINAAMFIGEMSAGYFASSQALQADALDFLGDSLTYGLSLAVIGKSVQIRTNAALVKGLSLLLMGIWVFGSTLYQAIILELPRAEVMGAVGLIAVLANLACGSSRIIADSWYFYGCEPGKLSNR